MARMQPSPSSRPRLLAPSPQLTFSSLPDDILHDIIRRATPARSPKAVVSLARVGRAFRDAVATYPWSWRDYPGWVAHLPPPPGAGAAGSRWWYTLIRDWYSREETLAALLSVRATSRDVIFQSYCQNPLAVPPPVFLHLVGLYRDQLTTQNFRQVASVLDAAHRGAEAKRMQGIAERRENLFRAVGNDDGPAIRRCLFGRGVFFNGGLVAEINSRLEHVWQREPQASRETFQRGVDSFFWATLAFPAAELLWQVWTQNGAYQAPGEGLAAIWNRLSHMGPSELSVSLRCVAPRNVGALADAMVARMGRADLGRMLVDLFLRRIEQSENAPIFCLKGSLFASLWWHPGVAEEAPLVVSEGYHQSHHIGIELATTGHMDGIFGGVHGYLSRHALDQGFMFYVVLCRAPQARDRLVLSTVQALRVPTLQALANARSLARLLHNSNIVLSAEQIVSALGRIVAPAHDPNLPADRLRLSDVKRAATVVRCFRKWEALCPSVSRSEAEGLVEEHLQVNAKHQQAREKVVDALTELGDRSAV